MNFILAIFFGALFASMSTMANNYTDQYISCFRACNDSFVEDSLRNGELEPDEEVFARRLLEAHLQESLGATTVVCSEPEFTLMAESLCFFAQNGVCRYGHPKPRHLPPFSSNLENAPDGLLELIGRRSLTQECIDAF